MIDGQLDVSYMVINPSIGFGATRVSVKTAKLLLLPVIWLPYWISGFLVHVDVPQNQKCHYTRTLGPENIVVAVEILMLCVTVREILLFPVSWLPSWILDTR